MPCRRTFTSWITYLGSSDPVFLWFDPDDLMTSHMTQMQALPIAVNQDVTK